MFPKHNPQPHGCVKMSKEANKKDECVGKNSDEKECSAGLQGAVKVSTRSESHSSTTLKELVITEMRKCSRQNSNQKYHIKKIKDECENSVDELKQLLHENEMALETAQFSLKFAKKELKQLQDHAKFTATSVRDEIARLKRDHKTELSSKDNEIKELKKKTK